MKRFRLYSDFPDESWERTEPFYKSNNLGKVIRKAKKASSIHYGTVVVYDCEENKILGKLIDGLPL